ncbi:MAG: SorB family sulfite dehydrogenase c-type cytochrome subunit [Caldimonas sp.]
MNLKFPLASLAIALACGATVAAATPVTITLPADGTELRPSPLPGFAKAQANCVACHSAEYFLYQPPNAGRPYWDAMTKRMKAVFKAPVDDADIPVIVDYLTATYGTRTP